MTINEAVEYLKGLDLANIEPGKHIVDDTFYYNIQEYDSKDHENCRLESHKNHYDIQWVISGTEEIDTLSAAGLKELVPYIEEKDVQFYEIPDDTCVSKAILTAGSFIILPPSIAHRPGMAVDGINTPVRKCVGKLLCE